MNYSPSFGATSSFSVPPRANAQRHTILQRDRCGKTGEAHGALSYDTGNRTHTHFTPLASLASLASHNPLPRYHVSTRLQESHSRAPVSTQLVKHLCPDSAFDTCMRCHITRGHQLPPSVRGIRSTPQQSSSSSSSSSGVVVASSAAACRRRGIFTKNLRRTSSSGFHEQRVPKSGKSLGGHSLVQRCLCGLSVREAKAEGVD